MRGGTRRLRAALRLMRSPARAWLVGRMLGWAAVLPVLKARMPLERLVAAMCLDPADGATCGPADVRRVAALSRTVHRAVSVGWRDNCLERSLLAYRYLAAVNAGPVLLVGTRCGPGGALEGHAWVSVDGEPVHDRPGEIATYAPLAAFGSRGRRLPVR